MSCKCSSGGTSVMTDIMCPAVLTVWRYCWILNLPSSGKSVDVVLVTEGSSSGVLLSIKQLSYLEATVLFFIEREIRQRGASIPCIIHIIVLKLYTLLILIQTLMHRVDALLERWNVTNVWWPFCWAGFLKQLCVSFSSDSQRSVWQICFVLVCVSIVLPVA